MNAREWKPGELATLVTVNGPGGRAVRRGGVWMFLDREGYAIDSYVTDVHPLVALDPEDYDEVREFVQRTQIGTPGTLITPLVEKVQRALRSYVKPPKPVEPTGLGAVVEDAEGQRWVRKGNTNHGEDWSHQIGNAWTGNPWDRIDAVRVLSEGVTQ